MTLGLTIAPVRRSLIVKASQSRAFDVFTKGIDLWWPKSHSLGETPVKQSIIEPRLGGRWYSIHEDGSQTLTGVMKVWEPPARIVFSWDINAKWKPDTTVGSEVEVRFIVEGANKTRIELEHRKFEPLDQKDAQGFRDSLEGGWPTILESFAQAAES